MQNSFSLKSIRIGITLSKGAFSGDGVSKTIEGLACDVSVKKPGLPTKNSASISVWGLKYEDMAEMAMLTVKPLELMHNIITIHAGEQGGAMPLVFKGEICSAYADYNSAPDVCMRFEAETGTYPAQKSLPVATVKGEVPADKLFAQFAAESGYTFRNGGVTTSVLNAWLPGSPIDKLIKLARDINCELIIDDGEVIIMPAGQADSEPAVFLSKDTGMIGYPTFNQDGINCRCLFNPDLAYGGLVQIQSLVPRASNTWRITNLSHNISAYKPSGGSWESQIDAALMPS